MTPERAKRLGTVLDRRQADLTVVLENVFDPHNVAAILRTCDAVGIREVFALSDRIPHRKAWGYRSSRSASKWVELHVFQDRAACLESVRGRYARLLATRVGGIAEGLYETDLTVSTALVLGNEQYGVSDAMASCCDGGLFIPQMGMLPSLNVSVACAVILFEALRQRRSAGLYENATLDPMERETIFQRWSGNADG